MSRPPTAPLVVAAPLAVAAQGLRALGRPIYRVNQLTLRQAIVPDLLLGGANASWRFLTFGAIPIGSLLGGALGQAIGLRATLLIGGLGMPLGFLCAARSPVWSLRAMTMPHR